MLKEAWVYKTVGRDGTVFYENKINPLERGTISSTGIAAIAKDISKGILGADEGFVVYFRPPYDFEKPSGLAPVLCQPLNEEEIREFFTNFS